MIILIKLDVINYQIFVGQNVSSGKKSRRLIYTTIYWMQAKKNRAGLVGQKAMQIASLEKASGPPGRNRQNMGALRSFRLMTSSC
jgi:hypothetical protein